MVDPDSSIDPHPVRPAGEGTQFKDLLHDQPLVHLDAHDHRLLAQDVALQVFEGLVSPVRDQDHLWEPGVAQVGEYRLHAPGVGDVAGKCPVIDWHMAVQGVHDYFEGLFQGQPILVPAPLDISQGVSIGRAARGVHGTKLALLQPAGPQAEQLHPL